MAKYRPAARAGQREGGRRRGWGRLRQLRSGNWQASYVGPDEQVHNGPTTFHAKDDAAAWLRAEKKLIDADGWTPPADRARERYRKGQTLGEYAETWLPKHRRPDGQPLKARTMAHYRKLLDTRILPQLRDLELRKITEQTVKDWHDGQGDGTPTYTAHAYSLLHLILRSAVDDKLISQNPCTVRGATRTKPVHQVEPATVGELATIVEHMAPPHRLAIGLMAWCALRFGEVTELRRSDIDLRRGRIHVQRAVVLVNGQRQVTTPKSEAGIRRVAIPPHLVPVIREHLAEHVGPRPDDLLFTGRTGGHLSQSTLNGKPGRTRIIKGRIVRESASGFRKACEAAGRPDLRLHDLRHTGAVLAAQTGATLAELMARLGHSTPSAAMRYQHAARDRDAEIAERLSKLAGA